MSFFKGALLIILLIVLAFVIIYPVENSKVTPAVSILSPVVEKLDDPIQDINKIKTFTRCEVIKKNSQFYDLHPNDVIEKHCSLYCDNKKYINFECTTTGFLTCICEE